jgi:hypothetical protein
MEQLTQYYRGFKKLFAEWGRRRREDKQTSMDDLAAGALRGFSDWISQVGSELRKEEEEECDDWR